MVESFGDKQTRALFGRRFVPAFSSITRPGLRKLAVLNASTCLEELRSPPANRLEKPRGDLSGFWSIRITDQWRVIVRWDGDGPEAVRIVDYQRGKRRHERRG